MDDAGNRPPGAASLEAENRWFDENRSSLLQTYAGKFVLIKDGRVHGSFDSAQVAYEAGVKLFGLEGFLVKQVLPTDPLEHMPAVWVGGLRASV